MSDLREQKFLRLLQILQLIPIGKSTLWEKVKKGEFPKQIKLRPKISVWKASDWKASDVQTYRHTSTIIVMVYQMVTGYAMISFRELKQQYKQCSIEILKRLVGNGKIEGGDYVALNPKRNDSRLGSFRIDIQTGRFHDFATGDRGGSILDLASFVYDCNLLTAAQKLQELFPFLAGTSVAADTIPAKKKKLDTVYIWNRSTKAQHQYLNNKKVTIGNARVNLYEGNAQLVIPLTDSCPTSAKNLRIKGLQFVDENGRKSFPLPFKGLFHVVSDYVVSKETIVICEGYATTRSIAESIDYYVIAAMSACNLKCVVEKIAKQLPSSKIIVAADNDEAGRKYAEDVKQAVNTIEIVYPTYECNDFNDLYVAYGAEAVKNCFEEVIHD